MTAPTNDSENKYEAKYADGSLANAMIGDYVRKNIDTIINIVAPGANEKDEERQTIKKALLTQADVLDPEGIELPEWTGSPDPCDPDNYWIDDKTKERVSLTGQRTSHVCPVTDPPPKS